MGSMTPYLKSQTPLPMPTREEVLNKLRARKGLPNNTAGVPAPQPFSYNPLPANGQGLSTAPGLNTMSIQPYGSPFAGMNFGTPPSGLLGLGQTAASSPVKTFVGGGGGSGFTGLTGGPSVNAPVVINPGLTFGMTPHLPSLPTVPTTTSNSLTSQIMNLWGFNPPPYVANPDGS